MSEFNNDQDYRAPLPTITDNLIMGQLPKMSEYIKEIYKSNDIDNDMKKIMISSRREYLELNRPDLIDDYIDQINDTNPSENCFIQRANDIDNFISKIDLIENKNFVSVIKNKLTNYISCKKNFIKLDPENYIIYENILPSLDLDMETINYVKKIIIPYDVQQVEQYKQTIELSKIEYEKAENIRKSKEKRKDIIQIITVPIMKIIKFDSDVNKLYQDLLPLINSYVNLEIDQIKLYQDLWIKTNKFINSVRISDEQRFIIRQIFILS